MIALAPILIPNKYIFKLLLSFYESICVPDNTSIQSKSIYIQSDLITIH